LLGGKLSQLELALLKSENSNHCWESNLEVLVKLLILRRVIYAFLFSLKPVVGVFTAKWDGLGQDFETLKVKFQINILSL